MELKTGLACRQLNFQWPDKTADGPFVLESINATFRLGSLNLVTGETGAGKSTLLHLLAGLLRPTSGEVWADGQPVSRWPAAHRDPWRQQVGIIFQHLAVVPDLTVAENLLLPLIPRNITWARMQKEVRQQLAAADLPDLAQQPARTLSGGQRQRLAIARALVGRPRYLLADEPTAYQDDDHTTQIVSQMCAAAEEGVVVIICSHDLRIGESADIDHRFHLVSGKLIAHSIEQEIC